MNYCTVINCLDGRIQLPVIHYLQKRFNAEYVDSITEAGPNLILSNQKSELLIQSILKRLKISVEEHKAVGIAIAGHHNCYGNPASREDQTAHTQNAIQFLRKQYPKIEIIGLWIDKDLKVHELGETS